MLKRNKKLFTFLSRGLVEVRRSLKFYLEGELPDKREMLSTSSPKRNVGLSMDPGAKIEMAKFKEDFFHDSFVYQMNLFVLPTLYEMIEARVARVRM